jgi:hypothetical protein
VRPGLDVRLEVVESAEAVIPAFEYRLSQSRAVIPPEPIRRAL